MENPVAHAAAGFFCDKISYILTTLTSWTHICKGFVSIIKNLI